MKLFRSIQALFERVVRSIEENPAPLYRYFQLFAAILAVRLALEFFSSHRLFRLEDVEHISLWFLFIVLAFILQLQLFSGEKLEKVIKLVVVCFTIALTAPIIDLLVSGGQGAKMNYLSINNWQDFFWNYLTMGGSSLSRGATLGIRIEIFLLVLASFNYVRTKTGSLLRSFLGAFFIYTVLVISGSIPKLLGLLVDSLALQYQPNDRSTLLLLLCADLSLIFFAIWRHSPRKMRTLLAKLNWSAVVAAAMLFVLGGKLAIQDYPGNFTWNPTSIFYPALWLGAALLLAANLAIRTRMNWPETTKTKALNALIFLLSITLLSTDPASFFLGLVMWGLQIILHDSALNLKIAPLLRNLLDGMQLGTAFLLGFVSFGAPMVGIHANSLFLVIFAGSLLSFASEFHSTKASIFPWIQDLPARLLPPLRIATGLLWLFLPIFFLQPQDGLIWMALCLPSTILISIGYQELAKWAAILPIILWFLGIAT